MGAGSSKPMTSTEKPGSTSTEGTRPGTPDCAAIFYGIYPYLLAAFVAGVLLTLLVVCLIKKCCPKNPTSDSPKVSKAADPSHKCCPTAEEACPNMPLRNSEENKVYFAQHPYEEPDPIIYAQIKVQTKTSLPTSRRGETHQT
ncbi:transmembrane protein C1orf162 homolog [Petaurus breviceps papuanus]|uniref:transmembrane protein C1orf162 homolog n=1 Tax=Petaurus breviceps papuanus TaxID=3040969 RepID=UPI0036D855AE